MLDKPYREAADGLMLHVKNATREERAGKDGQGEVVIEGDFEVFSLSEMDMWGGHLRFTFYDTEAKDEEARSIRGELAMLNPQIAHMLSARAQMTVERRNVVTVTTIKTIKGREVSRESEEREEWEDVTAQFHRMSQRDAALRF